MTEADSFADFYSANRSAVLRSVIAASAQLEHAEDAAAEAFQRAWSRWSQVSQHSAPAGWVVVTALNILRDRNRRVQRNLKFMPRLAEPEAALETSVVDPALLNAIRDLSDRQREVIALRIVLDLSAEQTADYLNISVGSVGTHLSRGLAALRAELANSYSLKD